VENYRRRMRRVVRDVWAALKSAVAAAHTSARVADEAGRRFTEKLCLRRCVLVPCDGAVQRVC
jgi:hypothetical protein